MNTMFRHLLCASALLAITAPAMRAQSTITPYVWASALDVGVKLNGRTVLDQHIGFTELLKDVDAAAMLRLERQFGRWGGMLDLFWVGMSTNGNAVAMPDGTTATLDSEIGMGLIDATASYAPRRGPRGLELVAGTRILIETAVVDLTPTGAPGTPAPQHTTSSDAQVSAIAGFRYRRPLLPGLLLVSRGDAGTGGTEFTWSASSELNYFIGASQRWTLKLGYRHLSVDYHEESETQASMKMSGLITGLGIRF